MDDTHSVKGMGVYSPVRSLVCIPTVYCLGTTRGNGAWETKRCWSKNGILDTRSSLLHRY
jgi:hypothetical protein